MASLTHWFAKHVGLPLKFAVKGEAAGRVMRELNAAERLSAEALLRLRTARLRNLLARVAACSPFYEKAIRSLSADPNHDDPWQILAELPLIDKQTYRDHAVAMRSRRPRSKPLIGRTSGTTGERLLVYTDRNAAAYSYLAGFRGRSWWGIEPGDPEFKIWANRARVARSQGERFRASLRYIKDRLTGITVVEPFFQSDDDLRRAADLVVRVRPKLVFGYANGLYLLADYLLRKGISLGASGPRLVVYTSEMLLPAQRDAVARAFGAPVASHYGSTEMCVTAFECPEGTLHTVDDIAHVEILAGDHPAAAGQPGEIVVTNLMATDYPLIRYRQGDLAIRARGCCVCGRAFGGLESLVGRKNDALTARSGAEINFMVFSQAMKAQESLRRFKVVERGVGDLVVLGEPHAGRCWSESDRAQFLRACQGLLPSGVSVEARAAAALPQEPSGKFRVIVPKDEAGPYLAMFGSGASSEATACRA